MAFASRIADPTALLEDRRERPALEETQIHHKAWNAQPKVTNQARAILAAH
jgi:hypothetical protein